MSQKWTFNTQEQRDEYRSLYGHFKIPLKCVVATGDLFGFCFLEPKFREDYSTQFKLIKT